MTRIACLVALAALVTAGLFTAAASAAVPKAYVNTEKAKAKADGPYKEEWDSLKKHPVPEWYRDAKFGIYFHWGAYCVPAFGSEWYPRNMHIKKCREYKHHVETYGEPTE